MILQFFFHSIYALHIVKPSFYLHKLQNACIMHNLCFDACVCYETGDHEEKSSSKTSRLYVGGLLLQVVLSSS